MLLQMEGFHFLCLNNISLCICIHIHTHTHHIFFVFSSIEEHLGCFHILAAVNNATITCSYHFDIPISIPLDISTGVGFLGHVVVQFLGF